MLRSQDQSAFGHISRKPQSKVMQARGNADVLVSFAQESHVFRNEFSVIRASGGFVSRSG
jgi:hypothetical protein